MPTPSPTGKAIERDLPEAWGAVLSTATPVAEVTLPVADAKAALRDTDFDAKEVAIENDCAPKRNDAVPTTVGFSAVNARAVFAQHEVFAWPTRSS